MKLAEKTHKENAETDVVIQKLLKDTVKTLALISTNLQSCSPSSWQLEAMWNRITQIMLSEEPNKIDNNNPLEIYLNLLSFIPLWKAILTIKEAMLNEIKGPPNKSMIG